MNLFTFAIILGTLVLWSSNLQMTVDAYPVDGLNEEEILTSQIDADKKSGRQFQSFLNLLGNLNLGGSNLLIPNRQLGVNSNGTMGGVESTTRRLQGRPGLGIVPDVSKGVDTILQGVADGNLEKILEGSFVFAPNSVQLVAGNVLDRVFRSTPSPPPTAQQTTQAPTTMQQQQQQQTTISSIETQKLQLEQIMKQQEQLKQLQQLLEAQAAQLMGNTQQQQQNVV